MRFPPPSTPAMTAPAALPALPALPARIARIASIALIVLTLLSAAPLRGQEKYWVYFRDKGPAAPTPGLPPPGRILDSPVPDPAVPDVGQRALRRRMKMLRAAPLLQREDLPVNPRYVEALVPFGAVVAATSRWMNAVSAVIPGEALTQVASLPFVDRVAPVKTSRKGGTEPGGDRSAAIAPRAPDAAGAPAPPPDYGPSFAQLDAVRVPALHAAGIAGRNILVGLLDSGYRWREHRSLAGMLVLKEYDFVSGDQNTADGPGDPPGQDSHGTLVLSVLGGYAPGRLIGPAFSSGYLLAKTESVPTETQAEEDYWAAGIEWLEANGADVINSSVGYNSWDDGSGYSWGNGDFDGGTSVVAKAAARAARLGVVLCVAMGNEGNGDGITGTMLTPADVDTAVSVGAASFDGLLSTASSTGPTSDGRVKPDIAAPGVGVYAASTGGYDAYSYQSGTSLASPLAAGAAALLLSARPEMTPVQVRDAIRASADTARIQAAGPFPNNFTGWGYLDAFSAVARAGPVFSNRPEVAQRAYGAVISTAVLSAAGLDPDSVILRYWGEENPGALSGELRMSLDSAFLFPGSGRYSATIPPQPVGARVAFVIGAVDAAGRSYASPSPWFHDRWILPYGAGEVEEPAPIPTALRLLQNYPNPFNAVTNIVFDLPAAGRVTVSVYNILGELVAAPFAGFLDAGAYDSRAPVAFQAGTLPSGVYLCRIASPSGSMTGKMMLLR